MEIKEEREKASLTATFRCLQVLHALDLPATPTISFWFRYQRNRKTEEDNLKVKTSPLLMA
jgi:hypothetical protein